MSTDVASMIDNFVDGGTVSEANLSFTFTEEQMEQVKNTFSPLQFEDKVRLEFHSSGKIIVSTVDKGVKAWVIISTVELDLNGENYQEFYLDRARLNKLADNCTAKMEFQVSDGEVVVKIGEIDLHITLPIYEIAGLDEEEPEEGAFELLPSETVEDLCLRCLSSKGAGPFMLPVMTLGPNWYYGTSQSVTMVKGGFKDLKINTVPSFLDYINNLAFTKEDVRFQLDPTGNVLTVSSGNVYYRVGTQMADFHDITPLLEDTEAANFKFNSLPTISDLGILSIPLIGIDDATFTVKSAEGSKELDISVRDEGNKLSYSKWETLEQKGEFEVTLNISSYLQATNAMAKAGVKVSIREIAIILQDDVQTSILMAYM